VPVSRCCPRCGAWHAVLRPCPPRGLDLTAWVAGTLVEQREADENEARAISMFLAGEAAAG
jgi:hypothetical protein